MAGCGETLIEWGKGVILGNLAVRKVDAQGRVALPSSWRTKILRGSDEVVVIERDDMLLIRPRRKVNLTEYFDRVKVDVNPKVFVDYNLLKRALLRGETI